VDNPSRKDPMGAESHLQRRNEEMKTSCPTSAGSPKTDSFRAGRKESYRVAPGQQAKS
jgi:hypothetical protein